MNVIPIAPKPTYAVAPFGEGGWTVVTDERAILTEQRWARWMAVFVRTCLERGVHGPQKFTWGEFA